jgi:hypothetical protein
LFVESVKNRDHYLSFTNLSPADFIKQLGSYIFQKVYLNNVCDLIPLILANAFQVGVTILNYVKGSFLRHDVVPSSGPNTFSLCLLRNDDHYSALCPSSLSSNSAPASTVSGFTIPTSNKFESLSHGIRENTKDEYDNDFPTFDAAKKVPKKTRVSMPKFQKKKTKKHVNFCKIDNITVDSAPVDNKVIIVGTSHARGVGVALNRLKVNAISLSNPGCNIHHISRRIHHMIPSNFTGRIVLQIGGNDCADTEAENVKYRYESMLFLLKQIAPQAHIFISEIPPRLNNPNVSYRIREVNDFLHHLSLFESNVCFLSHPFFTNSKLFKRDGVHMNDAGFSKYISNLNAALQDFQLARINKDPV